MIELKWWTKIILGQSNPKFSIWEKKMETGTICEAPGVPFSLAIAIHQESI